MKVTLPYQMVLLVRGEGSKIPLTVLPHEIDILRVMHGEDAIHLISDAPPIKECTFETSDEYSRLEQYYRGNADVHNPTKAVFRTLTDFEDAFNPAGATAVSTDKAALVEEAKALGIPATKNWGVDKLQSAIDEAKASA